MNHAADFDWLSGNAFAVALPDVLRVFAAEETSSSLALGEPFNAGCMEGALHYAIAAQQAQGDLAQLVSLIKFALLNRLGLHQVNGLSHTQEREKAFVIGILGELELAFERMQQPDTPEPHA